jgi:hypothetical protein
MSGDVEGPQTIVVSLKDEAGNVASEPASVTFDFTPPSLVGLTATPATVGVGGSETIVLQVSKPLSGMPMLNVSPAGLVFMPTQSGTTFSYVAQVGTTATGTVTGYTSTVAMVDDVGNPANPVGPSFSVQR